MKQKIEEDEEMSERENEKFSLSLIVSRRWKTKRWRE